MIEIDEIAIRELHPFPPERRLREPAQVSPRKRLRVRPRQPARRPERAHGELSIRTHAVNLMHT
jgi:hypothetical protein